MAATASSESQGKTVALIIFVLLTIVCGVIAFYYYDQVDRLQQDAATAAANENAARDAENKAKERYRLLRLKVFATQNADKEDHDAVMKLIEEDLGTPRLSDERKKGKQKYETFKDALDWLQGELDKADKHAARLSEEKANLEKEIVSLQAKNQVKIDEFRKDKEAKEKELKDETEKFQRALAQALAERQSADDRYNKALNEGQDTKNNFEVYKKRAEAKMAEYVRTIEQFKERERLQHMVQFVKAAGAVTDVSRSNGTTLATINLGSADGLLKGTTFGVYGRDKEGNPYQMPKAGIEVVRIRDPHRAEARLYGEQISDMVLPGDLLYNPIWTKGKKLRVGILGLIYMDNDNEPDNEEFVRMVRSLGAEVDSIFDIKDRKKKGKMDVETSWLVVGEMPEERESADQDEKDFNNAINAASQQMRLEAKEKGIPIINVRNFLTFMGHQQPQRTVRAGEEREYLYGKGRDPLPEKGPLPAGSKPNEGSAGQ